MVDTAQDYSSGLLLTDIEVEEFRSLALNHAGAELTAGQAQSVAGQLLRILATVRDVAARRPNASVSSVDSEALPNSAN